MHDVCHDNINKISIYCILNISKSIFVDAELMLDILKMASCVHMGRIANIIIKDTILIFASISKIMRILVMGRRNRERCWWISSYCTITKHEYDPRGMTSLRQETWEVI